MILKREANRNILKYIIIKRKKKNIFSETMTF